jgi:hypothetical protein
MKQPGFFDVEERLSRLSGLGDQMETRKNRLISGEAGWFDDVEVAGRTKGHRSG